MQTQLNDPTAPEWASRLLKIPEVATIVGENPVTVYRKVEAGLYPDILHIGSSSRIRGWELWGRIKRRMNAVSETEAA
jgi:predicted DNA-binding transcriptional regulator AlpA